MVDDLKTPGFFIIAILGTIVTAGFFLAFFPTLFKKRIHSKSMLYSLVVSDVYGNNATSLLWKLVLTPLRLVLFPYTSKTTNVYIIDFESIRFLNRVGKNARKNPAVTIVPSIAMM